jgi:hypothetical protein
VPDDKKKDLKSRLGRRRLRTASRKRLEQQKKQEEAPKQEAQRAPSGQQQRMPGQSVETPVASPPGASAAPGVAQGEQSAAPVNPEFNIDPNFGKTSKKMMVVLAILIVLPALGFGYCTGNRVEQNKMANYAREDAGKILVDVKSIQTDFNKMAGSFKVAPKTISDWKKNFQPVRLKPDLATVGRSKLTWIPKPNRRKDFMSNLVTYYSNIMTINYFYNNFVNDIQTQFQKHGKLFEDLSKENGKNIGEQLKNYMKNLLKARQEKVTKKGAPNFLVLMEGSPAKSVIVPFDETNLVCPSKPKNCPCKRGSKPTETKDCERECPSNCQSYQKVYKYNGREYFLNTNNNKNIKYKDAFVAVKFEEIAPRSLNMIVKYEIKSPVIEFFKDIRGKFGFIQKMIKQTEKVAPELINTLEHAKERSERGLI